MIEFASPEHRMFNGRYTTDPLRVALSLIAGAATYAILMVLWFPSHVIGWGPIFPLYPLCLRGIFHFLGRYPYRIRPSARAAASQA